VGKGLGIGAMVTLGGSYASNRWPGLTTEDYLTLPKQTLEREVPNPGRIENRNERSLNPTGVREQPKIPKPKGGLKTAKDP
jgi:hypothetical protein